MSHNVMISNVKITSLAALRAAVKELQAEGKSVSLDETSKTFRTYPGQPNKCDVTVRLPNEAYDVGLVKQPDGSYTPVFDSDLSGNSSVSCQWTPGEPRENYARSTIGTLMQRYSACLMEDEAAAKGHMAVRSTDENGDLLVSVEVPEFA